MMEGIRLTGLWKATDKNGQAYLAGNVNATTRLMVMKNGFREGENAPEYHVYLVPRARANDEAGTDGADGTGDEGQELEIPF